LINTGLDTWKAKRIQGGSPAIVWIDDEMGPAFIGKAELTNESAAKNQIIEDYPRKIPVGTDRSSQALKCVLRLALNERAMCVSISDGGTQAWQSKNNQRASSSGDSKCVSIVIGNDY
jgi:hypothetical protein